MGSYDDVQDVIDLYHKHKDKLFAWSFIYFIVIFFISFYTLSIYV